MKPTVTKSRFVEKLGASILARHSRESEAECVRLFHGDTEGDARIFIEKFGRKNGEVIWVFERERDARPLYTGVEKQEVIEAIQSTLGASDSRSIYWLVRPKIGLPNEEPTLMSGPGCEHLTATELGIQYHIRSKKVRHPGLFLDHFPLRKWLMESGEIRGSVLNTFSYTGSLSCAAFKGGAESVLTLDLSKPTIDWARENWALNGFAKEAGDFIFGDVFEWLPKFKKKGRTFNQIILDPPSFSRGKSGVFSTEKGLAELHRLAIGLLAKGGLLISSINSETISQDQFNRDLSAVLRAEKRESKFLKNLEADTVGFPRATHLKGAIVRVE